MATPGATATGIPRRRQFNGRLRRRRPGNVPDLAVRTINENRTGTKAPAGAQLDQLTHVYEIPNASAINNQFEKTRSTEKATASSPNSNIHPEVMN